MKSSNHESDIRRVVLPNGLRVITERMPQVRSVAMGVWVHRGSRHELDTDHGLTHFTEHMVFKGTDKLSAEDIACSIDAIGGHLDAFTGKESVAFTAKVLDEHIPQALDIVSEMCLRPAYRADDLEKEKGVVLEELKMDEDNPDYLLQDVFASNFWRGHSLGRPIIGTKDSIAAFHRGQIQGFSERTFRPENLVVTAAGRLDHEAFARNVEARFGDLKPSGPAENEAPPESTPSVVLHDKPSLEQVHVLLGVSSLPMADPRRYAAYVMCTLLGGGFSSRLFIKIREREGLAYSVYADQNLYTDAGCLTVYAGTSLEATRPVLDHILAEFRDLKTNLVGEDELRRAKDHLKGSLMLSLESTSSRMSNLARQEKYFKKPLSLDETIERIEQVTAEQIRELANGWFTQDRIALTVLGALDGFSVGREDLVC